MLRFCTALRAPAHGRPLAATLVGVPTLVGAGFLPQKRRSNNRVGLFEAEGVWGDHSVL
jgi:hypothetical protein